MAEIVLDHVSKIFPGGATILKETSFTIHDGEFFILVGPSGCGKSTLLNMIVGLESVSAGEITVDGKVVNDLDPKDRNMAMVFQSYAIYPHMSIRENIAFPLRMAKLPDAEITQRINAAADMLELTALLDRKPSSLSGGQRQRVAMGRALVREPVAFLLDEPLSNLDARLRVQMRAEIARLHKQLGTTMIYVTHDQTEAMTLGDRVAVMNQGVVQQIATPQLLYQQPANLFVASFIGSPGMNFIPAHIQQNRLRLPFGELELPEHLGHQLSDKSNEVIVGIRPEHLQLRNAENNTQSGLTFTANVELAEWLGSELNVYFDMDCPPINSTKQWPESRVNKISGDSKITLVARLEPSIKIQKGEQLTLYLNAKNTHLFNRETGNNLTAGAIRH